MVSIYFLKTCQKGNFFQSWNIILKCKMKSRQQILSMQKLDSKYSNLSIAFFWFQRLEVEKKERISKCFRSAYFSLRFRFAYWMRTVSPGQLATPGKNVPTICFQLCYYIFQAKVIDWQQYPGEGKELDATHTSPLGRPPDRAWSSATLQLTQSRPPCATLSQRSTLRTNLHLSPLWIGLLEVHTDLLHGQVFVS